jgi:hypothetical protein
MLFGRLIRVRTHRSDQDATIYVVAEAAPQRAIDILKVTLARPADEYEDLGCVLGTPRTSTNRSSPCDSLPWI